jgi:pyruvate dehydrogenase E1 component
MVHVANTDRPNESGVKIGGHQASSASMVEVMVALWFSELNAEDYVSVKPHASPVLHSINYLLGDLDEQYLGKLRERGGLQSYPSRTKDPDRVDFSTGSVGIGATATIWAALSHRYVNDHFPASRPTRRFIALLGDAELDEGAVWEAVADSSVVKLGEVVWIVDLNRQSLDRIIPDVQIHRLQGMFQAAGWQVLICKWGRRISELFLRPGGEQFRERMEQMPNEEFQRLLRSEPQELAGRVLGANPDPALKLLIDSLPVAELALAVRDLGGHDIKLLLETFKEIDPTRPTVLFAYTVKGRGLPTEGHPNNHSARLTPEQMQQLAQATSENLLEPWSKLAPGTAAGDLVMQSRARLTKSETLVANQFEIPKDLPWEHKSQTSTQAVLGRVLLDLQRAHPELASRIVTASPDVASSTNLGGWINKTGVWAVKDRTDWFADDKERLLKWTEDEHGQHIELGIAEGNLVGLLGELGATWSRWGEPLIPIGTLYDPFVSRALEPWSFGVYAGGQSILVGTPSGVTLSPEGGAHQSISTPSIGLEQPGVVAWEPAFAKDFEWCLLESMRQVGHEDGNSTYFRLSTRPINQELAELPVEPELRELRRQQVIAGGYKMPASSTRPEQITLVGVGAMMPEVIAARDRLLELGVVAAVLCITSPDLIFRAVNARARDLPAATGIIDTLFPPSNPTPIVTVIDGHPHTLSFLSGIRGDRSINLGVTEFGQSSSLEDAYDIHGIDTRSIVAAALKLTAN